jgi:hypothetical protein
MPVVEGLVTPGIKLNGARRLGIVGAVKDQQFQRVVILAKDAEIAPAA